MRGECAEATSLPGFLFEPPEPRDRADGQFEEPYDGDTAAERDRLTHAEDAFYWDGWR